MHAQSNVGPPSKMFNSQFFQAVLDDKPPQRRQRVQLCAQEVHTSHAHMASVGNAQYGVHVVQVAIVGDTNLADISQTKGIDCAEV